MQHRPANAQAFVDLNKPLIENNGQVTSGLKRLAGYVSSLTAGCRNCRAYIIRMAERYNVKVEQFEPIWDFETHAAFNPAEKAALRNLVDASTVSNSVNDELIKEEKKYWSDDDIVE